MTGSLSLCMQIISSRWQEIPTLWTDKPIEHNFRGVFLGFFLYHTLWTSPISQRKNVAEWSITLQTRCSDGYDHILLSCKVKNVKMFGVCGEEIENFFDFSLGFPGLLAWAASIDLTTWWFIVVPKKHVGVNLQTLHTTEFVCDHLNIPQNFVTKVHHIQHGVCTQGTQLIPTLCSV